MVVPLPELQFPHPSDGWHVARTRWGWSGGRLRVKRLAHQSCWQRRAWSTPWALLAVLVTSFPSTVFFLVLSTVFSSWNSWVRQEPGLKRGADLCQVTQRHLKALGWTHLHGPEAALWGMSSPSDLCGGLPHPGCVTLGKSLLFASVWSPVNWGDYRACLMGCSWIK